MDFLKKEHVNICPYHYCMFAANKVNLLICHYNYILSPEIRKALQLDIKDAIIVFDEAQNIENAAEQCYSKSLLIKDGNWNLFGLNEDLDENLQNYIKRM